MKFYLTLFAFLAAVATIFGAETPAIIPVPQEMTIEPGVFHFDNSVTIETGGHSHDTGEFLAARLRRSTGFPVKVADYYTKIPHGNILLGIKKDAGLGKEGYELTVTKDNVHITAGTQAGLFYGEQTLLQLLPSEILGDKTMSREWTIPCVHIKDEPRFVWRGLMLDVARHFFTVPEVEKVIDTMALYKLNTFHFHLVDDTGWRIQIKRYPSLTDHDAWRKGIGYGLDPKSSTQYRGDGEYGGFYTQDDIRQLVRYAATRHITIVPEIEMPGHSAGALVAYPEFSCTGGPFDNSGDMAIFCPGNEGTYTFLENILTEVFQLFPGEMIHVGGDEVSTHDWKECSKCQALMKREHFTREIQMEGYLIQRIEKFANAHGKRVIGWSEIRNAGLAKNAAVMDWIGGAAEAAGAGHDVVLAPASPVDYAYLDHYQSRNRLSEPRAIGGFLPLRQVYRFEPMPEKLEAQFRKHILGGQGNLWTEYVPNIKHAQYMIFPRELAMAEVLWSPKSSRDWDDFLARVKYNETRLDALGINYRRNPTNIGEVK